MEESRSIIKVVTRDWRKYFDLLRTNLELQILKTQPPRLQDTERERDFQLRAMGRTLEARKALTVAIMADLGYDVANVSVFTTEIGEPKNRSVMRFSSFKANGSVGEDYELTLEV